MKPEIIDLPNAKLLYFPQFFSEAEADTYLKKLLINIEWRQDKIKMFGKEILQPRLTALFANNDKTYTYSGLTMKPERFSEEILQIKTAVEEVSDVHFTTCLVNQYRNGQDSMGWHADDEKELGLNPEIASVSFGAERNFHFKHKTKNEKFKLILKHGSLLIMKGSTQHFWKHQLPKTKKETGKRINLTFRRIE
ncbi:alpha-ketoglutarate-dependent dioxygenase AlkB [Salegentibacter sp. F188]|uniref:Alpha-ketoglutarate-dependent dioxygenase AlkB n=1 Tax=Autumnicola patrickiae TaxID=3075591 RepID=A0ABU3DYK1_9FLAO|nr:alpha-ketoglutarate-dependent dioxygenase AlkB [Salegentibacter sp. F188]MDT0688529.1 alpha-ketoglutarate-dependent dioxygenase AlkB [Salegentibacter sp. F188]